MGTGDRVRSARPALDPALGDDDPVTNATKHHRNEADRDFRRAWKLLGRLERRLVAARAEEERRTRQLGDGTGPKTAKRLSQLEAAQSEIAEIEGLLTELTDLIAATNQAQSGQLVQDVAREVAASIRADAAAEPDGWPDGTPTNGRGSIRGWAPKPARPAASTHRRTTRKPATRKPHAGASPTSAAKPPTHRRRRPPAPPAEP